MPRKHVLNAVEGQASSTRIGARVCHPRKWTSGQGFRPQPMGLCLNGHTCQPHSLLIPTVQAWQNLYGSTSAAFQPLPSVQLSSSRVILNDNEYSWIPARASYRALGRNDGRIIHPATTPSDPAQNPKLEIRNKPNNSKPNYGFQNPKWDCLELGVFDHLDCFESRIRFLRVRNRNRVPRNLLPICDLNLRAIGL